MGTILNVIFVLKCVKNTEVDIIKMFYGKLVGDWNFGSRTL